MKFKKIIAQRVKSELVKSGCFSKSIAASSEYTSLNLFKKAESPDFASSNTSINDSFTFFSKIFVSFSRSSASFIDSFNSYFKLSFFSSNLLYLFLAKNIMSMELPTYLRQKIKRHF